MSTVYLNGAFLPDEQARVSVWDRGFIFGDGVYEVIPVYGGVLFRLQAHLERLQLSLEGVRIANPHTLGEWRALLEELVQRNGGGDLSLYLHITRGVALRDHAFPANTTPTVFASTSPLKGLPAALYQSGVTAITLEDIRWKYCHIKAIALLPNALLRQQAIDVGAAEAILLRDERVTEGAASNVFIVSKGELITPPKSRFLLPGITRDLVLELAQAEGVPCREDDITTQQLRQADEIWLTSSTREIVPVTRLDDQPVGDGVPGLLWRRVMACFQDYKQTLRASGTGR